MNLKIGAATPRLTDANDPQQQARNDMQMARASGAGFVSFTVGEKPEQNIEQKRLITLAHLLANAAPETELHLHFNGKPSQLPLMPIMDLRAAGMSLHQVRFVSPSLTQLLAVRELFGHAKLGMQFKGPWDKYDGLEYSLDNMRTTQTVLKRNLEAVHVESGMLGELKTIFARQHGLVISTREGNTRAPTTQHLCRDVFSNLTVCKHYGVALEMASATPGLTRDISRRMLNKPCFNG